MNITIDSFHIEHPNGGYGYAEIIVADGVVSTRLEVALPIESIKRISAAKRAVKEHPINVGLGSDALGVISHPIAFPKEHRSCAPEYRMNVEVNEENLRKYNEEKARDKA